MKHAWALQNFPAPTRALVSAQQMPEVMLRLPAEKHKESCLNLFFYYGDSEKVPKRLVSPTATETESLFFVYSEKRKMPEKTKQNTFGNKDTINLFAPTTKNCCGARNARCGKPPMASGGCCGKRLFRPECCVTSTAQQLFRALRGVIRGYPNTK